MDVGYLKENALPRLVTRDPMEFWTSGQWMTEKRGGSDVGASTTTYAVRDHDSHAYRLHGYKWFSSATDADMAFTLARVVNEDGQVNQGSAGLSLFYVETRDHNGSMNNIIIEKLKDKLGTRQLPTAELLLDGTIAQLVGDEGRGIPNISPMLTITRLHNVMSSVAAMRRITFLARDYSTKRRSFGKYLADHPLFMRTLASLELETRGCLLLALELAELLGKEEMGVASPQDVHLLRLMMPVAKLYTAKQAVSVVSEGLECFGGQGYIEDTGIPTLFRDSQVLPIWEGTTNILSLDVLRAIKKSHNEAILALGSKVDAILSDDMTTRYGLETETHTIKNWYETLVKFMSEATSEDIVILAARDISFTIAQVYVGVLLLKVSCDQPDYPLHRVAVKRWCQRNIPLMPHDQYERQVTNADVHLIMDGYKLSLSK
jgi:alkylation response protein AidB-like acyl-CoA dehydrogenase